MGIKLCVVGAGQFFSRFVPLFRAHPLISEVSLAELDAGRRAEAAERFAISRCFSSLEDALASDVDAIGLFTQRWTHGPLALKTLRAGKHVYSAVPMGITVDEIGAICDEVARSGLVYMMGETSYYYPAALYCRERFRKGDFGRFVYGEGEYLHDMIRFYGAYSRTNGDDWKPLASFPPMLYPSHSVALVLSVTGAHTTKVSCLGTVDQHEDGVFRKEVSRWGNALSNEVALFRTSDGGTMRINEFRRVGSAGEPHVRTSIFGTDGAYEEQVGSRIWTTKHPEGLQNLWDLLTCSGVRLREDGTREAVASGGEERGAHGLGADPTIERCGVDYFRGVSVVHPVERLPREYVGIPNGHEGAHPFLADDFARAVAEGKQPVINAWTAARYCLPGIVAHESAQREGEQLAVPDFGDCPSRAPAPTRA